ncbi:MAG: AAA family ATPase, partial [Promethearchaeia archaeon]
MKDKLEKLKNTIEDDNLFYEIQKSNIDLEIKDLILGLKFRKIYLKNFQSLSEMNKDFSNSLNIFVGGNRTGKSSLINALAFSIGADISDKLSHSRSNGKVKSSFFANNEVGKLEYNITKDRFKYEGNEEMINTLKNRNREHEILVWKHKTDKTTNFFYKKNKVETLSSMETKKWNTIIDNFFAKRKQELEEKLKELNEDIDELESDSLSIKLIDEEIKDLEKELKEKKEEKEAIITELKTSFSMKEKDGKVDLEELREKIQSNKSKIDTYNTKKEELEVKLNEFKRLSNITPTDFYVNEKLTSKPIRCPMCDEKLERETDQCPVCGTEKEVEPPSNIELRALRECAVNRKGKIESKINDFEQKISKLERENKKYQEIINDRTINNNIDDLENQLEELINIIAEKKNKKKKLMEKKEKIEVRKDKINEKKREREQLQEKKERLEKAELKLINFDKDEFAVELKRKWFD